MNKRDLVNAAMALAEDVTGGKIDPAALDTELFETCRELFARVVGEGDPLWPLQNDVARQVLTAGVIPATELQEWAAVARQRAQDGGIPAGPSDHPGEAESVVTEPHSLEGRSES